MEDSFPTLSLATFPSVPKPHNQTPHPTHLRQHPGGAHGEGEEEAQEREEREQRRHQLERASGGEAHQEAQEEVRLLDR